MTIAFALGLAAIGGTSAAFVRLQTGTNPLFWPQGGQAPISYVISSQTAQGIPLSAFEAAVRRSFQSWEALSGASITFVEDPNPSARSRTDYQANEIHTVIFDTNNSSGFFENAGLVAVTPVEFLDNGTIADADIILNAKDHRFSTTTATGTFDVQAVVTHEVGHFLGLDHSCILGATMVPFAIPENPLQRSLSLDDAAGLASIYPSAQATNTSIRGRVLSNSGSALSGAHVVAIQQDGQVAVSGLTDVNGDFSLKNLSSQEVYRVYVEPLDGPVTSDNISTGISNLRVDRDFGTTFYGSASNPSTFTVSAGQSRDIGTINCRDKAQPQEMNITSISRSAVPIGSNRTVTLACNGLRTTDTFEFSSPGIQATNVIVSGSFGTLATLRVNVDSNVLPGLYTLIVRRSTSSDCAVLTGAIEATLPAPTLESVSPNTAESNSQAVISLFGSHFVNDLKVIVGGMVIDNVTIVSSSEARFTLPMAAEVGTFDLSVENPDGQFTMLTDALQVNQAVTQPTPQPGPSSPPPPPSGGGGGGGGGGGCSVSKDPAAHGPLDLAPIALLLFLILAARRR